ncbi:MAG TPA: ComEA family DNA-binding protein [Mollicutes bacterium]|nr:ComEA family DNA-binding protein [Mollicutes bacterium]
MIEKSKPYLILSVIVIFIFLIFFSYIKSNEYEEEMYFAEETTTTIQKNFYVDVKGAVNKPGVYEFKNGDRVITAIEKAEGLSKNADTSNINLSKRLTSEMVVYIYTASEIKKGAKPINCDTLCSCEVIEVNNCYEKLDEKSKININTASLEDLLKLSGIGQSKAEAIIKYRNDEGLFNSIEDIVNVTGIGEKLFESIREYITI